MDRGGRVGAEQDGMSQALPLPVDRMARGSQPGRSSATSHGSRHAQPEVALGILPTAYVGRQAHSCQSTAWGSVPGLPLQAPTAWQAGGIPFPGVQRADRRAGEASGQVEI